MNTVALDRVTDTQSDADLVAAINTGDTEAFEVLYRRHRDWTVNLACRFTDDPDLALDVLQDTFLYVLKKFPGFRLTCQFRSFLYPAVRNLAIAARRKAARLQSTPDTLATLDTPPDDRCGQEETASRERLSAVLARLPEAHREVLLLRFVDGLSLAEVGTALAIPVGTVKSRLHSALETLRNDPRTQDFF